MKLLVMSLLFFSFLSCKMSDKKQNRPSFKQTIKTSPDSDNDGHNDLEERLLRRNPKVAELPNFKLQGDWNPNLTLWNYNPDKQISTKEQLILSRSKWLPNLAFRRAVEAIYSAFRLQQPTKFPHLQDSLMLELGCLQEMDRIKISFIQEQFLLERLKIQANLNLIQSKHKFLPLMQQLHADLAFVSKDDKSAHYNLSNLLSHYSTKAQSYRVNLGEEIVNNKLELAQLSQFNACFYLNLSKVEYQIDQKRIELLGQMQEMAQKNSIVIFISDNQQWIKSVNPEGAVKQTLSTAGLSNIINNNDIYTVFNNVPRSAENLHRKQWFFLSADGADLNSDAKATTYILAHLNADDFKNVVPARNEKELKANIFNSINLEKLSALDQIFIEAEFFDSLLLPSPSKTWISGVKLDKCRYYRGGNNGDRCMEGWVEDKMACQKEVSFQSSPWQKTALTQLPEQNLKFKIGAKKELLSPELVQGHRAYYRYDLSLNHSINALLPISIEPHLLDAKSLPAFYPATQVIKYTDRSKNRRCIDRKTQRKEVKLNRTKKLQLTIKIRSW